MRTRVWAKEIIAYWNLWNVLWPTLVTTFSSFAVLYLDGVWQILLDLDSCIVPCISDESGYNGYILMEGGRPMHDKCFGLNVKCQTCAQQIQSLSQLLFLTWINLTLVLVTSKVSSQGKWDAHAMATWGQGSSILLSTWIESLYTSWFNLKSCSWSALLLTKATCWTFFSKGLICMLWGCGAVACKFIMG